MLSSANVRQRDKDLRAIAPPPTHTSPQKKYPPKHTSEGRPVLCPAARVPHEATPNHSEHTAGSSSPNCAGPRSGGRGRGRGTPSQRPVGRGRPSAHTDQPGGARAARHFAASLSLSRIVSSSSVGRGGLVEKRREGGTGRIQSTKAMRRTTADTA